MSLNFPASPSNNQIYFDATSGNRYKYNAVNNVWFYTANNDIQGSATDTQIVFDDAGSANGSPGLVFNKSANTLTANTINAYSMRVTGNLYIGSNTVVISNNSIIAQTIFVGGSSIPTGQQANAVYDLVNAAFTVANSAYALQNNDYTMSNAAYTVANAAFGLTNTTYAAVNSAFAVINAAYTSSNADYVVTNAVFTQSNTDNVRLSAAYVSLNAGYTVANAAFGTANGKVSKSGDTITGTLSIVGDLVVSGNTYQLNANTMSISDPLIYLAANNYSSDIVDIGFIANYVNTAGANVHTGLYREHTDKEYYLFQGYDREPINNHIGAMSNNMTLSVLNADIRTSNLNLGGANAITWISSGYGVANAAFAAGNAEFTFSNTIYAAVNSAFGVINAAYTSSNADYVLTNAAFTAANAKVATVSGTSGRITSSGSTGITLDLATAGAGAASYSSGISALTVDAYGRVTSVTGSAGYATTTQLGNYLPLAGGTMTGQLNVIGLTVGQGQSSSTITMFDSDNGSRYIHANSDRLGFLNLNATGWWAWNDNAGNWFAASSSRAPIFYDSDNTSYYVDPTNGGFSLIGGTSNRVSFYTGDSGYFVGNPEGNGATLRIGSAWGYTGLYTAGTLSLMADSSNNIEFRIANAQKGYMDSSSNLFAFGSMRSPIFYDSNNTGYYADPASTSVFNDLRAPGHILQVVQTVKTSTTSIAVSANTYNEFDSGFRVTITPKSTASRIVLSAYITGAQNTGTVRYKFQFSTNGGSSWSDVPGIGDAVGSRSQGHFGYAVNGDTNQFNTCAMELVHSPSTTSAIIYRVLFGQDVSTTYHFNRSIGYPNNFLGGTLSSTLIAKEIGG
jgi:hypothetical protein